MKFGIQNPVFERLNAIVRELCLFLCPNPSWSATRWKLA